MDYAYRILKHEKLIVRNSAREGVFDSRILTDAVIEANAIMHRVSEFEVNIFEILGMRNLSAFVGEVYARAVVRVSNGLFVSNPHQDGYPDLLLIDEVGEHELRKFSNNLRDKAPFSPFRTGGIEVKATCGTVPTPKVLERRGLTKPSIGEQRIDLLSGYDWKAHHRETNNLAGLLWDFVNEVPTVVALFYSSNLTEQDWGAVIQPREGGGRTTSVSIMTRAGVSQLYQNCLMLIDDDRYASYLDKWNKSNLLTVADQFFTARY